MMIVGSKKARVANALVMLLLSCTSSNYASKAQLLRGQTFEGRSLFIDGTSPTNVEMDLSFVGELLLLSEDGSTHSFCTGALISEHVFLTAAHCIFNKDLTFSKPLENIRVKLYGEDSLIQVDDVKHPGYATESEDSARYRGQLSDNDIALEGTQAKTLGFGCSYRRTDFRSVENEAEDSDEAGLRVHPEWATIHSDKLTKSYAVLYTSLKMAHNRGGSPVAAAMDSPDESISRQNMNRIFGLGGDDDASMCFGDSGGPVVVVDEDNRPVIIGVNQAVIGMPGTGPDIAVNVGFYRQWIRRTVKLFEKPTCDEDASCDMSSLLRAVFDKRFQGAPLRSQHDKDTFPCNAEDGELFFVGENDTPECLPRDKRCDGSVDILSGTDEIWGCSRDSDFVQNACGELFQYKESERKSFTSNLPLLQAWVRVATLYADVVGTAYDWDSSGMAQECSNFLEEKRNAEALFSNSYDTSNLDNQFGNDDLLRSACDSHVAKPDGLAQNLAVYEKACQDEMFERKFYADTHDLFQNFVRSRTPEIDDDNRAKRCARKSRKVSNDAYDDYVDSWKKETVPSYDSAIREATKYLRDIRVYNPVRGVCGRPGGACVNWKSRNGCAHGAAAIDVAGCSEKGYRASEKWLCPSA
eukprot:g1848.t1